MRFYSSLFLKTALFISIFQNSVIAQVFNDNVYKFGKVLNYVNLYYVDSVKQDKLTEDAIIGMLQELDPHSIYISKEEVEEMNEPLEGNFEGIGIQFNILDDTILVISPTSGGPSEKLGILSGDRIIKIEGINVAGVAIKNQDVVKKLRGKKGTQVIVSILRKGDKDLLDFTITRDKIPIYSLDASYMVDNEIGYIKINRFANTTMTEYLTALEQLKSKGMKHLILDLRGNSGGYLKTAIELSDQFLEPDNMIVYTEGLNSERMDYKSTSGKKFRDGKVIVMVDEGAASASEIVSGALQDWDRGIIVGRRTFGKGLVQRPFDLSDGSMIRLTVARYYTPNGRSIQKPYEKGFNEYSRDLINRYNSGELTNADSIHFPDSLKYKTLVNHRTVYGGGGIMPDVFVPLDTTRYTDYYMDMIRKGILNKFILTYIDNNRKELNSKYPDFQKFNLDFSVNTDLINDLVDFAEKEKLPRNQVQIDSSLKDFQLIIKAMIARDLWNTSEYFEIVNMDNPIFLKSVEVLKDKVLYNKLLSLK